MNNGLIVAWSPCTSKTWTKIKTNSFSLIKCFKPLFEYSEIVCMVPHYKINTISNAMPKTERFQIYFVCMREMWWRKCEVFHSCFWKYSKYYLQIFDSHGHLQRKLCSLNIMLVMLHYSCFFSCCSSDDCVVDGRRKKRSKQTQKDSQRETERDTKKPYNTYLSHKRKHHPKRRQNNYK